MRAIHCVEYGEPTRLALVDLPEPEAGAGEVVVSVEAAGLGFADALNVKGAYQVKRPLPFIPGGEMAGRIVAIGPDVPGDWLGKRVLAVAPRGSLAERTVLPVALCTPLPDKWSAQSAACALVNYCTAIYGLEERGQVKPGETVLILGAAGGVGLSGIDVAKALGATVVAAASSPERLRVCVEMGADLTVDYSQPEWRKALEAALDKRPLDVVYDPVGGPYSEIAFRCLSPGGRLLVVGFAAGEIPRIPLNLPLLKRASIVGVDWGGSRRGGPVEPPPQLKRLIEWVNFDMVHPRVGAVFPLEEAGQVLQDLLDRKLIGKPVIRVGG